jgi:hypothetical protein
MGDPVFYRWCVAKEPCMAGIDVGMQFALTQLAQPKERKLMSGHFPVERRITK